MSTLPLLRTGGLLLLSGVASAQETAPAFALRGFGTLGVARSDTDQAEFIRDVSQPKGAKRSPDLGVDSRVGVQGNYRFNESWEAVAQAVASRRYDASFTPEVTWAFLKWRASDTVDLRAGRLGFDVYPLADTRNVGYSYLWVRPPVEFYGGIPITDFDGADLLVHGPLGGGFAQWKVFAGKAQGKIPSSDHSTFNLSGSPLLGTHVDFHEGGWGVRLAFAQLQFKSEFNADIEGLLASLRNPAVAAVSPTTPALAEELAITDKWVRYLSLSFEFEQGAFRSQLSLSRTATQTPVLPTSHAGYLTLSLRSGAWTPYLSLAAVKTASPARTTGLPDLPPFQPLNAGVQQYLGTNRNDQRTLGLGVRWDLHRNLCLKAQVDAIDAGQRTHQLWWRADPAWNGRATVATLSLDFVF
ncbi:MAG TPA: hypothetical protein VJ505_00620 [Holophagaceae bacterium]|nr:hypothetical protein [Holophagaceae bacterium]